MIDVKIIKENPGRIEEEIQKRGLAKRTSVETVKRLVKADRQRRALQQDYEQARSGQKKLKSAAEGKKFKPRLKKIQTELTRAQAEFDDLYLRLPNFSAEDVPVGPDETGNKTLRQAGKKPGLKNPREHFKVPAVEPLFELERAAKVSGSRFNYLRGPLARLHFGLANYALSVLTDPARLEKIAKDARLKIAPGPFIPIIPPAMVRTEMMQNMGRLDPAQDKYHLPDDGLTLSGSAEHTIGPMHAGETLAEGDLPLRYIGYSTCFRREAGSYGKDTHGILRRHQFDKLEMESFTTPETSRDEQDFLVAIQEHLVGSLDLPYQVVAICTGDMGLPDSRQIDIECWMPGQGQYRETHTADLVTDFQARRLGIKFRRGGSNQVELVHMNDATAFAIGRTIIAIIENYQDKNGNVDIPEVLKKYLSFKRINADGTTTS